MSNLFSIVITNYNKSRFIKPCILSALSQKLNCGQFEVVVVDDCSTDESPDIIRSFGERVRLIRNESNRGALISTLVGCTSATGTYIVTLDGDDLLATGTLQALVDSKHLAADRALRGGIIRSREPEKADFAPSDCRVNMSFTPAYLMTLQRHTGGSSLVFPRQKILDNLPYFPPIHVQDHAIPEILSFDLAQFATLHRVTHLARNDDSIDQISKHKPQLFHDKLLSGIALLRKANLARTAPRGDVQKLKWRAFFRIVRCIHVYRLFHSRAFGNLLLGILHDERLSRAGELVAKQMRRKFPGIKYFESEMKDFLSSRPGDSQQSKAPVEHYKIPA